MSFDDSAGPKQVGTAYFTISSFAGPTLSICFRHLSSKNLILQTFPIHAGICTIGNSSANIVLDDDTIAEEHAMIQASDFGTHFIQDVSGHGVKFRFEGGDFDLLPNRFYEIREKREIIIGNSLLLFESLVDPIDSLVVSTNTTAVIQNDHNDILHNRSLTDGSPSLLDDSIYSDRKEREDEAIDGTPFKIISLIRETADHSPECSLPILCTKKSTNQASGPKGGVAAARNLSIGDETDTETVIDESPALPRLSESCKSVISTVENANTNQSLSTSITKNMSDIAYHKTTSFDSWNEDKTQEYHVNINDSNENNEEQESFFVVGQTQTGADALLALSRNSNFFSADEFTHDEETLPSGDQCSVAPDYSNFENTKPIAVRTYKSRNSTSRRPTVNAIDESVESENGTYKRSTQKEVQDETSSEYGVRRGVMEIPKVQGRPEKQKRQRSAETIHSHDAILDILTHTTDHDGLDASTCNEPSLKQDVGPMPKAELKSKRRRQAKCDRVSKGREILNESTAHSVVDSGGFAEIVIPKMTEIKNSTPVSEVAVRSGKKTTTSALRKVETSGKNKSESEKDKIHSSSLSNIPDTNSFKPEKKSIRYHDEGTSSNQKPSKKEVSTAGNLSKRKAPSNTKESQLKKLRKAEANIQKEIKNWKFPFTIMLTGLNPEMTNSLIRHIQTLKGTVTDDYNRCNILVTDKVRRTVKFLSAIAAGVDIVSVDWLTDSILTGSFLDPSTYLLNDVASEEKYKFSLKQSLQRAKSRKLFDGLSIFVTPTTVPKRDEIGVIIKASGGLLVKKTPNAAPEVSDKFIVIGCPEDMSLLTKLARLGYTVVSNEFVLTGVLRQEKDPESFPLNIEDISHIPLKRARRK